MIPRHVLRDSGRGVRGAKPTGLSGGGLDEFIQGFTDVEIMIASLHEDDNHSITGIYAYAYLRLEPLASNQKQNLNWPSKSGVSNKIIIEIERKLV